MRLGYTITTHSLNSKACSGNTLVLQAPEVQGAEISWQDNVHNFLGRWRYIADWLYASESDNFTGVYYADLLHKLCLAIKEKRRGKLTKVPLLLHDNAPAHRSHVGHAAYTWIRIWRTASPTIFSWPGTEWLPSLSKFEATPPWTEIFDRWCAQLCDRRVVEGAVRTLLFHRRWETSTTL